MGFARRPGSRRVHTRSGCVREVMARGRARGHGEPDLHVRHHGASQRRHVLAQQHRVDAGVSSTDPRAAQRNTPELPAAGTRIGALHVAVGQHLQRARGLPVPRSRGAAAIPAGSQADGFRRRAASLGEADGGHQRRPGRGTGRDQKADGAGGARRFDAGVPVEARRATGACGARGCGRAGAAALRLTPCQGRP